MRISDWSSDVCSSALRRLARPLPAAAEAQLKQDKAGTIKAVLVVQVDTASSTANDIAAIRKAIDAAGHGRAVPARHHRLPRHHAVRDGRLGRRRRRPRITEGADDAAEAGRASCRERGCRYVSLLVVAVHLQKKNRKY